ncbi:MAG TPA: TolC family protein, partial [Arenibacter sp.]|nr:TolC family protein [Arenibacter sp.]
MILKHPIAFTFLFLFYSISSFTQEILTLNRQEAEALFLKENLMLMAEKLEIPKAEALVTQARLWPNPTLSIDDVNLWATPSQKEPYGEELPPLFGNFGKYQQFGISLEQLITTAGKRKKLIALEQVTADKSRTYFEDLLRNLKIEFRKQLTQLQHLQLKRAIYANQIHALGHLVRSHQKQVQQGHIPKGDYIRLKALELEFLKNSNDLKIEINAVEKELKILMHLPPDTTLALMDEGFHHNRNELKGLNPALLIEQAKTNRPDLHLAELDQRQSDGAYAYEKAKRIPDVTLKAGYERGGNILYNFIGFGIDI